MLGSIGTSLRIYRRFAGRGITDIEAMSSSNIWDARISGTVVHPRIGSLSNCSCKTKGYDCRFDPDRIICMI